MNLEVKDFPLECKSEDTGRFTGYAATYARDAYGDRIAPGAFAKSIKDNRGKIPIFFNHSRDNWIGLSSDLAEDAKGLYIDGSLNLDSGAGKDALSLLKMAGKMDYRVGLSIGFVPVEADMDGNDRILKAIDLYEVSITPFPANAGARVESVKSIRNFEQILRDVGGCSGPGARRALALLRPYLSIDMDGNQPPPERDAREMGRTSLRIAGSISSAFKEFQV